MKETVEAKWQVKDSDGNVMTDEEGKAVYKEVSVEFDFGDDLDAAVDLCGADAVFSNYKANAKVGLQSILRAKGKAGISADQIQTIADGWKPGMVVEKTVVDPESAIANAWDTWSPEKRQAFLEKLGVPVA